MAMNEVAHDEVELGDLEGDAFIPGGPNTSRKGKPSIFMRWLPARMRMFLENLSRIKLVLLVVSIFILSLVGLSYWNGRFVAVSISSQSLALSKELAKTLSDTAIPEYVLTYAPLVFLDKGDPYFPSDMAIHISQTHPALNFTAIANTPDPLTLNNLDGLNDLGGDKVYLTSTSSVIKLPWYLKGQMPNKITLQTEGATSCVIIVVDKGKGVVDAFYMYFYTFNHGPTALGHVVGDHLGDWEHNMIRFENGEPKTVWYSQHDYGAAYTYKSVRKAGKRPIAFSAKGSHANYAVSGSHDLHDQNEVIPVHIAYDHTSQGPLWDPTLSAYYYTYTSSPSKFTPVVEGTPVNYLYFQGKWGDEEYPDGTEGQEDFHGFHRWIGGPQGPLFKHLDRLEVCWPGKEKVCTVRETL